MSLSTMKKRKKNFSKIKPKFLLEGKAACHTYPEWIAIVLLFKKSTSFLYKQVAV